jgi:hypothetical protein
MRRLLDRLRNLVLFSRHELPGKTYLAVQVQLGGRRWARIWERRPSLSAK